MHGRTMCKQKANTPQKRLDKRGTCMYVCGFRCNCLTQ